MKEKNELCELSAEQQNPYLCDSRGWEVMKDGVPFHGQCGDNPRQYRKLLRDGERVANASNFTEDAELHPNVNRAGKPHTP